MNTLEKYFNGDRLASEVWNKKYRIKDEKTPDDMFDRISGELARLLSKRLNNSIYRISFDTNRPDIIAEIRDNYQKGRLKEYIRSYLGFDGIIPAGSMLNAIGNETELSSISNCFVIGSPHDSISGINISEFELSNIEKRRGGVGIDLSTLRPNGSVVHNQSHISSGVTLFEESFSDKNRTIAQNGRRGALMLSLSIKHPDSLEFIKSKQDLSKVTGANISIKIDEDFIEAVEKNKKYIQTFPIDVDKNIFKTIDIDKKELNCLYSTTDKNTGNTIYFKIVDAKQIWNEIIHCAWNTAEPGIIFENNWKKYGLDYGYEEYRPVSTNPCSEIPMQPYDSCRLMSINLYAFVVNPFKENAYFDFEKFEKYSYMQLLLTDIAVDLEIERVEKIIENIEKEKDIPSKISHLESDIWKMVKQQAKMGRRCGCGFTGLHDVLASKGLKYSSENIGFIEKIFISKLKGEFAATIDLSKMFGKFEGFDIEKEKESGFTQVLKENFPEYYEKMKKYGRRNVSWSTAAPTGSLSILAGTTSGIEPLFMPFYKRRKKCITSEDRVDFVDVDGEKFTEYFVVHPKLVEFYSIKESLDILDAMKNMENMSNDQLNEIFENSPYYESTANDINHNERIDIQSIVQKYTTHAISSTINLPEKTDEKTISDIYMKSCKKGLKGNTIYRDGCRQGVLVSINKPSKNSPEERPNVIDGVLHKITYRRKTYSVLIGFIEDKPYEVFILSNKLKNLENEDISQLVEINGKITKDSFGVYSFESNIDDFDGDDIELVLYDLDDMEDRDEKIVSLFISRMLRENISIDTIVKTMEKSKPFVGTLNYKIIKVLSKYSKETDERCPSCGDKLTRENGCKICKNCGWTAC